MGTVRAAFWVLVLIFALISCSKNNDNSGGENDSGNNNIENPDNTDPPDDTISPSSPSVTLTAMPSSVLNGGSTTLEWSSQNATQCMATGAWSGGKDISGSEIHNNLTQTQTYTLTCTGAGGSADASATVTVSSPQNLAPTATFVANPISGPAPLRVQVDASASGDADGTIVQYNWFFGDSENTTATGRTSEHTYIQPGQYTLMLTVRDDDGVENSISQVIQATDATGTQILSLDYEEEDWSLIFRKPDPQFGWSLGDFHYGNHGWAGSNAFKFVFSGHQTQNDTGWALINQLPADTYNHIFVGHLVKLSADLIAKIELSVSSGGIDNKWQSGVFAWNDTNTDADGPTRQVSFLRGLNGEVWYGPYQGTQATGGVGLTLVDGGAGYPYGWAPQEVESTWQQMFFDFNNYADQWVWVVHEYDYVNAATSLHYVTRDGVYTSPNGSAPYLKRDVWSDAHFHYGSYVRDLRWWAGYWKTETLTIAEGETVELTIDNFRVSTVWIDPPAGFFQ